MFSAQPSPRNCRGGIVGENVQRDIVGTPYLRHMFNAQLQLLMSVLTSQPDSVAKRYRALNGVERNSVYRFLRKFQFIIFHYDWSFLDGMWICKFYIIHTFRYCDAMIFDLIKLVCQACHNTHWHTSTWKHLKTLKTGDNDNFLWWWFGK